jgi:formate--tetrahydrofolate ligase
MKKDIEIAQEANIRPIAEIAAKLGIPGDELEMYGRYKAKIPLHFIDEERIKKAKLILIVLSASDHCMNYPGPSKRRYQQYV